MEGGGPVTFWKTYGRNKRSVVLNLREATDREALWTLIDGAHVLIENYRPGTLEQMGFGPDIPLARKPDLVVVRISGFEAFLAAFIAMIAVLCSTGQSVPRRSGRSQYRWLSAAQ